MHRRSFIAGLSAVVATLALPFRRPLGPLAIVPGASTWHGVRDGWTGEPCLHYIEIWPTTLTHEQMAAISRNQNEHFGLPTARGHGVTTPPLIVDAPR
jgi:hypothetical protein